MLITLRSRSSPFRPSRTYLACGVSRCLVIVMSAHGTTVGVGKNVRGSQSLCIPPSPTTPPRRRRRAPTHSIPHRIPSSPRLNTRLPLPLRPSPPVLCYPIVDSLPLNISRISHQELGIPSTTRLFVSSRLSLSDTLRLCVTLYAFADSLHGFAHILSSICSLLSTIATMLCCTIAVYPLLAFGCIPRYLGNRTNIMLLSADGSHRYVFSYYPEAGYVSLCTLLDPFSNMF